MCQHRSMPAQQSTRYRSHPVASSAARSCRGRGRRVGQTPPTSRCTPPPTALHVQVHDALLQAVGCCVCHMQVHAQCCVIACCACVLCELQLNPRAAFCLKQMSGGPAKLWSCGSLLEGQRDLESQAQPSRPVPRMEATLQHLFMKLLLCLIVHVVMHAM